MASKAASPSRIFTRSWTCPSCAQRAQRASPRQNTRALRHASTNTANTTSRTWANGAPTMADIQALHRKKNQTTINYGLSIVLGTVALSYASVPLYRMICQQTGFGGQPIRSQDVSSDPSLADRLVPITDVPRLRITFRGSTSDILPWKFTPQQREVRVYPGETALAFYTATNKSDSDIIGVATYSVAPGEVAPYFSKIQCFCFEEQRLNAGETVDMPVFFYIDKAFLEDVNMKGIMDITLNYTFFKAKYDKEGHLRPIPGT